LDEVEKSLCWWEASLGQPLHNDEMILALEDVEEDYWMRLRRACAGGEPASPQLRSDPPPGGRRGRLLDEVEKSLCWWEASLDQPFHNSEVTLTLEDREVAFWMRLRRACAVGKPALTSLSTIVR
jgi:hypothetical protein